MGPETLFPLVWMLFPGILHRLGAICLLCCWLPCGGPVTIWPSAELWSSWRAACLFPRRGRGRMTLPLLPFCPLSHHETNTQAARTQANSYPCVSTLLERNYSTWGTKAEVEANLDFMDSEPIPREKTSSPPLGKLYTYSYPWGEVSLSEYLQFEGISPQSPSAERTRMLIATSKHGGQWRHEIISVMSWMRVGANPWTQVYFATFPPVKEIQDCQFKTHWPLKVSTSPKDKY